MRLQTDLKSMVKMSAPTFPNCMITWLGSLAETIWKFFTEAWKIGLLWACYYGQTYWNLHISISQRRLDEEIKLLWKLRNHLKYYNSHKVDVFCRAVRSRKPTRLLCFSPTLSILTLYNIYYSDIYSQHPTPTLVTRPWKFRT